MPFLKAYKIWLGGNPPAQPYYCLIERIKKDPLSVFTYCHKGSMVKCDVGLHCADGRWKVGKNKFEQLLQSRSK